jgi:hypothetical protein
MPRSVRALAIGLSLIVAIPGAVAASTPATSTVTVPTSAGATVTDSWTGTAPPAAFAASTCFPGGSPLVDEHAVSIVVAPGTYDTVNAQFTFNITWTPASGSASTNDLILTLIGPDGLEIASSDGGAPSETVIANNLAAGTYRVVACGFLNTSLQPYAGTLTVTTSGIQVPPTNILPAAG